MIRAPPAKSSTTRPRTSSGRGSTPRAPSKAAIPVGNGNKREFSKTSLGLPPHIRARHEVQPQASKPSETIPQIGADQTKNVIAAKQDVEHPKDGTTVMVNNDLTTTDLPSDTASHLGTSDFGLSRSAKTGDDQNSTPTTRLRSPRSSASIGASAHIPTATVLNNRSRSRAAASDLASTLATSMFGIARMHYPPMSPENSPQPPIQHRVALPPPANASRAPMLHVQSSDRVYRSPANNDHSRMLIDTRGHLHPTPFIPQYRAIADTQVMPVFPAQEQHVLPSSSDQQCMWLHLPPVYAVPDPSLFPAPSAAYPQFQQYQLQTPQFAAELHNSPPGFVLGEMSPVMCAHSPGNSPYTPQSMVYNTQPAYEPLDKTFDVRSSSPDLRWLQTQPSTYDDGSWNSSAESHGSEFKIKGVACVKPHHTVRSPSECREHFQKSGVRLSRPNDDLATNRLTHEVCQSQSDAVGFQQNDEDLIELASDPDDARSTNSSRLVVREKATSTPDHSNAHDLRAHPGKQPGADAAAPIVALAPCSSPVQSTKSTRKPARIALKEAWFKRESCRKQFINSNWSIDKYPEFEIATNEYNARREELARLMASGQLNEGDQRVYPKLIVKMFGAPKVRPPVP